MSLKFCKHLIWIKHYTTSIKNLNPTTFIFYAISLLLGNFFWTRLALEQEFTLSLNFFIIGLFFLFASLYTFKKIKKNILYVVANPFFLERFSQKNKSLPPKIKQECEKSSFLHKDFPLFKITYDFYGEKLFDINIQKKEKPHVIFLFLESLTAKYVGSISQKKSYTPYFDKLSKEGVLFTNFYSNGTFSERAFISTLFGIYSSFETKFLTTYLPFNFYGLPQIFKQKDYQLAHIQCADISFNNLLKFFKKYEFDHVIGKTTLCKKYPNEPTTSWGIHDKCLMQYCADWLEEQKKPTFLSMLSVTSHHPWELPYDSLQNEKAFDRYLKTLRFADEALELFIQRLRAKSLSKDCIIFVMGDHGHSRIGREENYTLARHVYEENVHVPLLILADGRINTSQKIDEVTSHIDLLPTLLDLFGWQAYNHGLGTSMRRKAPNRHSYFINPFNEGNIGIRKGNKKLIYNLTRDCEEYYDLKEDPEEKTPLQTLEKPQLRKILFDLYNINQWIYAQKNLYPVEEKKEWGSIENIENLTDSSLIKWVKKAPYLHFLDLSKSPSITDKGLIFAAKHLKQLLTLNLSNCNLITDRALFAISEHQKHLHSINLNHCHLLTSKSIQCVLSTCEKLEFFSLQDFSEFEQSTFENAKAPLTTLDLLQCSNLTDECLWNLKKSLKHLKFLHLDCTHITEEGFIFLAKNCTKLVTLHLENLDNVQDTSLLQLAKKNSYINSIVFKNGKKISDHFFKHLNSSFITHICLEDFPRLSKEGLLRLSKNPLTILALIDCPKLTDEALCLFAAQKNMLFLVKNCVNISEKCAKTLKEKLPRLMYL